MASRSFLAVDIGASSGRHLIGRFDGRQLALEEVYRFDNGGVDIGGTLYWNLPGLWASLREGLRAAGARAGRELAGVGVDTWGVDFGLLDRNDQLIGNPVCYRDDRTQGMPEHAFSVVPREEIFRHTGLQFMQINTLYQLAAMKFADTPQLEYAETLLMMPDLFHWLLTGQKCNEMTEASTSQLYNPVTGSWSIELIEQFGLPPHIFQRIVQPGTELGPLRREIAEQSGLTQAKVILPGTHDTASAVMAVPAASQPGARPDWCYISLGTWALMGIESPEPVVNDTVLEHGFTNEGGVGGTIRLLKNITGLWLLQECQRTWAAAGRELDWNALSRMAGEASPRQVLINPDAGDFLAPDDMPAAIREYCRNTGQSVPESDGAVLRCALDSIALKFRQMLAGCEDLAGRQIETIHIVGGGTQNTLLMQAAADACGRRVVAGPIEATGIGNCMMQMVATGEVADIAQAREVVRRSFPVDEYEPRDTAAWDDAYGRFQQL